MKYCAKCQYDYEDHVEVCSDCGGPLEQKVTDQKEGLDHINEPMSLVHLVNVDSDMEAERLIVLLASEGIVAIKKFKGTGSYLNIVAGVNYQGVDLYVAEDDFEDAQECLQPVSDLPEAYSQASLLDDRDYEASKQRGQGLKWMVRLGIVVAFGVPIVYELWRRIDQWLK